MRNLHAEAGLSHKDCGSSRRGARDIALLTSMRNNDTNTAGVVEQAAAEEVETDKKDDGTEA